MLTTTAGYKTAIDATTRQLQSRVSVYFDATPTVFTGSRLIKWSLLEETKSDLGAQGRVSSNTLKLTLANYDRALTPTNSSGSYYGKLLPNVKIELEIGLLVGAAYEWLPLGTFWSGDWLAPESSIEATVDCYDRLYALGKLDVPVASVQRATTVATMLTLLFTLLDLDSAEYSVDASLTQPITIGWLGDGSVAQCLQMLAEAGNACVYMDRSNVIQARSLARVDASSLTVTDTSQLLDVQFPQRYKDIHSQVTVSVYSPADSSDGQIGSMSRTVPGASELALSRQRWSSSPVSRLQYIAIEDDASAAALEIHDLIYSSHAYSCTLVNPNSYSVTPAIKAVGRAASQPKSDQEQEDAVLKALIGDKKITIDNPMIQDKNSAITYGSYLLARVSDGYPTVSARMRGNPAIELCDTITLSWDSNTVAMVPHRIQMDFDGGLTSTIEGFKTGVLTHSSYSAVSPGLYVYSQDDI